jgi:hypothetical protein
MSSFPRRCESCLWWDSSTQHAYSEPDTTGICRARAPVADERDHKAVWPFTEYNDWCASHELDRSEPANGETP